jgi:hypothetical protein
MDLESLSAGWLLVNIIAPLCLPVLGIVPLWLLPLGPVAPAGSLRLIVAVKDGQLCWGVVGMSAAAIYELWEAKGRVGGDEHTRAINAICTTSATPINPLCQHATALVHAIVPILPNWTGGVFVVSIVLMLPAAMVAAGGAVFTTPLLANPIGWRSWISHYKLFASSLAMVVAAATCYIALHMAAHPQ